MRIRGCCCMLRRRGRCFFGRRPPVQGSLSVSRSRHCFWGFTLFGLACRRLNAVRAGWMPLTAAFPLWSRTAQRCASLQLGSVPDVLLYVKQSALFPCLSCKLHMASESATTFPSSLSLVCALPPFLPLPLPVGAVLACRQYFQLYILGFMCLNTSKHPRLKQTVMMRNSVMP